MLWIVFSTFAAEPDPLDEPVSEEVIVAEQRLSTALDGVHGELRERGYRRVVRAGHRAWYLTPKLWKPWVMVHDEGFARVRGLTVVPIAVSGAPPVQLDPHGNPIRQPPPLKSVWITTLTQGRAAKVAKEALAGALEPALADVRDARWGLARAWRRSDIRSELVAIWVDGDGPAMARRSALADRWCATTDTDAGAWARDLVLTYIDEVVQVSDHPFLPAEVEAVNRACPHPEGFTPRAARS